MNRVSLFLTVFIGLGLFGCATVQPKYEAFPNIIPNSADDLKYEFIDVSGRDDSRDKIQKQEYIKTGSIEYQVPYDKEELEKVKTFAKNNGYDAIIIKNTNYKKDEIFNRYYGIYVITIKYK